jgi:hypothetical protein
MILTVPKAPLSLVLFRHHKKLTTELLKVVSSRAKAAQRQDGTEQGGPEKKRAHLGDQ